MAYTFSQMDAGLDAAAARLVANHAKLASAAQLLADVAADNAQLITDYTPLATAINAAAAAAPSDAVLANAAGKLAKYSAEATATGNMATAAKAAITL